MLSTIDQDFFEIEWSGRSCTTSLPDPGCIGIYLTEIQIQMISRVWWSWSGTVTVSSEKMLVICLVTMDSALRNNRAVSASKKKRPIFVRKRTLCKSR